MRVFQAKVIIPNTIDNPLAREILYLNGLPLGTVVEVRVYQDTYTYEYALRPVDNKWTIPNSPDYDNFLLDYVLKDFYLLSVGEAVSSYESMFIASASRNLLATGIIR